jgi:pterin-4a-carbinolamine dehydratase
VILILAELLYVSYQFSQKVYKRARKLPKVKAYYQKVEMQVTYHEMSGLSFVSRTQSMATQPDEV